MRTHKPSVMAAALVAAGLAWGSAQAASPQTPAVRGQAPQWAPQAQETYYLERIPGTNQARKVYIFSQLDTDHDGQLSRSEIPGDMHALRQEFMQADWDGNGSLSPREYYLWAHHLVPAHTEVFQGDVFVP